LGRPFVDHCGRLWPAWRPATHIKSWRKAADLKTAADRYVVRPNNVSIDADGLVDVSVEPVVVSVHALPSAR
jgi:hypothetical protein